MTSLPTLSRVAAIAALGLHLALLVSVCAAETHRLVSRGLTLLPVASRGTASDASNTGSWLSGVTAQCVATYRHLAGIERGYGYFAPNVPDAYRLVVEVDIAHAEEALVGVVAPEKGEAGLRVATFLDTVGRTESPRIRHAMLKALAQSIFAEQPGATQVRVVLESIRIPDVAGVRAGAPTVFAPIAVDQFSRADVEQNRG